MSKVPKLGFLISTQVKNKITTLLLPLKNVW